jgi:hypothetical protein
VEYNEITEKVIGENMSHDYPPRPLRSPRLKILPSDFLFTGVCIIGALAALFFFWRDLNVTMSRLAGEPVGVVSYKYRAAQRRFVDRVLWDRLKQESPVYNGDFIRTAELAEATIRFFAGDDRITMEENTLIQILISRSPEQSAYRINLADGVVSAETRDGAMRINSGDTVIDAAAGSVVQAAAASKGRGLDVAVLEGSALVQAGTKEQNVAAGEVFTTAEQGAARVAVLSPRPQAKFLNNGEAALPVSFEWTRMGLANNDPVRIDVAEDRSFTRVIKTLTGTGSRAAVDLTKGVYYWRVYPESETDAALKPGGVSGRLTVVHAPPPHLISPAQDERFSFKTARSGVRFQWTAGEGAAAYLVEVAANTDMQNAVYQSQVQTTGGGIASVVYTGLEPGAWYWRVSPVYPRDYEGTAPASQTARFVVEREAELAAPELQDRQGPAYLEQQGEPSLRTEKLAAPRNLRPASGHTLTEEIIIRDRQIAFSWDPVTDAAEYTFTLFHVTAGNNTEVLRRTLRGTSYTLTDLTLLDAGVFLWRVEAAGVNGGRKSAAAESRFVVDIPEVEDTRSQDTGVMFGTD